MNTKLKLVLPAFALTSHWSAFAQGIAEKAASAASGPGTNSGPPYVEWFVVVGVSAVVAAAVSYAVASKVVSDNK